MQKLLLLISPVLKILPKNPKSKEKDNNYEMHDVNSIELIRVCIFIFHLFYRVNSKVEDCLESRFPSLRHGSKSGRMISINWVFINWDLCSVGLVLGGVLEIFKILLPRLGSYRVSRFFWLFIFFVFQFFYHKFGPQRSK